MISQNVINPTKKDNIHGTVFHLFYVDLHTSILFDRDLSTPIIWGSKNVVMGWVKRLDELLNVPPTTKIRVYSYIITTEGYRRTDIYNGPISTVGKYIKHI